VKLKTKNTNKMKFVKFGIFALSMGLFVASCGDSATTEEGTNDTTTVVAEPAPAAEVAPAAPATTDSAAAAPATEATAPAAEAAPATEAPAAAPAK